MIKRILVGFVPILLFASPLSVAQEGDPAVLAQMEQINVELAARGMNIQVAEIRFFTIGGGRPAVRILQQPFRWVPNDGRRAAQGDDITYLVDQSAGATASGLTNAQTEAAVDRSLNTWDGDKCLKKVDIVKRIDSGADATIFDSFFPPFPPFPPVGNEFLADIVEAGWLPRAFFEAVGGPGGGDGILAFSVTFTFTGTDINGDGYADTALNEVYYNDTFGTPDEPRAGFPWGIDADLPSIDVETVALHENGHSLELGHFGPPPAAVMNPIYAGQIHDLLSIDQAGACAVWRSWPKP